MALDPVAEVFTRVDLNMQMPRLAVQGVTDLMPSIRQPEVVG